MPAVISKTTGQKGADYSFRLYEKEADEFFRVMQELVKRLGRPQSATKVVVYLLERNRLLETLEAGMKK